MMTREREHRGMAEGDGGSTRERRGATSRENERER